MNRSPVFLMAFLLLSGTVTGSEPEDGPRLLAPFKQHLQQALRAGLSSGPAEAIALCRDEAPAIAEALSGDSVRMGRSSHRLRNPANAGPRWVAPILEAYVKDTSERLPRTVVLEDNLRGYVEPIFVQPVCLACHGEDLAADVAAQVNELYPADQATGFEVGDLRGVFWVEFPASD